MRAQVFSHGIPEFFLKFLSLKYWAGRCVLQYFSKPLIFNNKFLNTL